MQEKAARRSNTERARATRKALIEAARRLFVEKSYADTATPDIVTAAGVTRGALYHHFADKQALFRAVVEEEAASVAEEIERATPAALSAKDALLAGGEAFLAAMALPGRTRLLLLDGPAVLGRAVMDRIDGKHSARTLKEGLSMAMKEGKMKKVPLDALTALLSATFDRAALAIEAGTTRQEVNSALGAVIEGLFVE